MEVGDTAHTVAPIDVEQDRWRRRGVEGGVETDEQRLLLIDRNCDLIQGWLVAPAMPLDAFSEWMVRVLPEIQHRFAGGAPLTVAR